MLNSKKHLRNSENFLQKHRAKEDSYTSLLQKVSKDATLKEYVNFSNKAEKIFRLKHLASQKQLLAEQHKTSLASRRQKLFDILSHENNAYKKELWSLDRASETLKSDLLSRIEKMHEIKEYRRKEFVKEQMDQLFEKNNEDMRQIKQERFRLENVKTLEGQILEKQQDMIKDYEENLLYQEYSRRMREKEVKKEIEKRMEYDKMIEGNARIINLQIKDRENERDFTKKFDLKMNQEIKNRFDFDLKLELKKNGDKIKEKREIGKKFITENQQHEKKRLENEKESKENDKIWLQAVLEKEQLIRSMEINEKMKNIKKKQQIYLNPNTMNDYEKEIDKFIQKETDKKSKEQDEKLKKAEEKRLKLLFETYDSRKTELMKKKETKEKEKKEKLIERDELDSEINKQEQKQIENQKKMLLLEKVNQNHILTQSSEKQKLVQRKMELEELERNLLQSIEKNLEEKLNKERKINLEIMTNLRKSYPY